MNIRVLEDRIIVRRIEARQQSAGGIIIPERYQERATEAQVLAVGPGCPLDNGQVQEMRVSVGDRVLLGKYAGTEITVGDEALVIIRESDVLGILEVAANAQAATAQPKARKREIFGEALNA